MRRLSLLLAVLFVVPLLGSDSPTEYNTTTVREDELQGVWRQGEKDYIFHAGKWVVYVGNRAVLGTYTTDTDQKPAHLDLTQVSDKGEVLTRKCIYRIEGGTLRIAREQDGGPRPKSFEEKAAIIITWERVKK
jgi:uncharacterized protein (TIGR03067 family)